MAEDVWKLIINRTRVSHFAKDSHGEEYLTHIFIMYII